MSKSDVDSFVREIRDFVPSISLDCVVFGYANRALHVLLLRYKNTNAWALPGGFLPKGNTMEGTVSDILKRRTGVEDIFLRQFHTFSAVDRGWNCNEFNRTTFNNVMAINPEDDGDIITEWFEQRFVSTAFMALIDANSIKPEPDFLSDVCTWVPIAKLPNLILDHRQMIQEALVQLRTNMNYLPIGKSLLGEYFTMSDFQLLYEVILGKKLDRGNFQRKIMRLGILKRHGKLMTGAQNKAPYLYSIDAEAYDELIREGIGFV